MAALRLLTFQSLLRLSSLLLALTTLMRCRLWASVFSRIPRRYLELLMFHKLVCMRFLCAIEDNNEKAFPLLYMFHLRM